MDTDEALAIDPSAGYHVCLDRLTALVENAPSGIDDVAVKVLESQYADVVKEAAR